MDPRSSMPSDEFLKDCKGFGDACEDAWRAYQADRWRRRAWWAVNAVVVPVVLVPIGLHTGFTVGKPPDVPSLFAMLFVMAACCTFGGVSGGAWALFLFAGLLGWQLHRYPFSDWRLWVWFMSMLFGYATVLAMLYFRAPDRRPFVPPRGPAYFRRRQGGLPGPCRRSRPDNTGTIRRIARPSPTPEYADLFGSSSATLPL
jgi:hypothetical protein